MPETPRSTSIELSPAFSDARNVEAYEKARQDAFDLRQDEIKLDTDMLGPEQVSRRVDLSRTPHAQQSVKKDKDRKNDEMAILLSLLDDLRDRLAELERSMEERYETLRGKYGQDVIAGMAATFLDEETANGLKTDEARMRALASVFLDKNGDIKDKYKNLEEAKYVRDWNEAETLRPVIAKYEGRNHLTAEEGAEVFHAAQSASLAENKNMIMLSENSEFQRIVDEAVDHNRSELNDAKTTAAMSFR